MKKDHIDILCFSGHKGLMGPQGTGAICVRPGVHVEPLKVGGSGILTFQKEHPGDMPEALEAGTLNSHGIAGLRAALEWIQETGVNQIREKEQMLMWRFYDQVKKNSGSYGVRRFFPERPISCGDTEHWSEGFRGSWNGTWRRIRDQCSVRRTLCTAYA